MKSFGKKTLVLGAAIILGCLTGCGAGEECPECPKEKTLTAVYNSSTFTFFTAYPGYTYKQLTTSVEVIKTYSDNTYEVNVISKNLSGALAFDPSDSGDQNADATERGQTIDMYYGTFTSSEEEGFITLNLSSPTDVVMLAAGNVATGTYYYDSINWTDEMGVAAGGESGALTREQFIENYGYDDKTVVVDGSSNSFTYTMFYNPYGI